MPTLSRELTVELGASTPAPVGGATGTDLYETTPELAYPANLAVFDRMRRTDSQQRGILRAVVQPIVGTRWFVPSEEDVAPYQDAAGITGEPTTGLGNTAGDVDPRVRAAVEAEFGLRMDRQGRRRARPGGVSWDEFIRHACLMLPFGHMAFEQVYAIGPADITGIAGGFAHLAKLAPRLPRTFTFDIAGDTLRGIVQTVPGPGGPGGMPREVPISIERLIVFSNEREGADWAGQSVLRASYKDWLLKDLLIKLAAMSVERTGMGLPVLSYDPDSYHAGPAAAQTLAQKIVSAVRAGEDAGVTMPTGWQLELLGVSGSTVDPLPLIKYHDQAASKGTLAMFLDLGHDAALGSGQTASTMVDVFEDAEAAVVHYLEEVITEHGVRDFCRVNFGPDEPYPPILADPVSRDQAPTAESLASLASAGLLGAIDEELVRDTRRRNRLPVPGRGIALVKDTGAPADQAPPRGTGAQTPTGGPAGPGGAPGGVVALPTAGPVDNGQPVVSRTGPVVVAASAGLASSPHVAHLRDGAPILAGCPTCERVGRVAAAMGAA